MNVFEDLIVELKQENLLEDTVIDLDVLHGSDKESIHPPNGFASNDLDALTRSPGFELSAGSHESPDGGSDRAGTDRLSEIYRKRATAQVSYLQMVEHVLSAVERTFLNIEPDSFDDIAVKMALHRFLQVSGDDLSEAEGKLTAETEAWRSALANRDRSIPVSSLRRYSETCQPALSPQALFSLARFYRELPYNETNRGKFDFIVTRLFSKSIGGHMREPLFGRDEIVGHLKSRYSDWSGQRVSFSADDPDVLLTVLSFEDFVIEADNAEIADDLVKSDFFKRMHLFKESISQIFFSPLVTAAAISCNIRIGNKYIELIEKEKGQLDPEDIQIKYGSSLDAVISDAAGRTLGLDDLLEEPEPVESAEEEKNEPEPPPVRRPPAASEPSGRQRFRGFSFNLFGVNKWLLVATVLVVALSVGVYFWAEYFTGEKPTLSSVKVVDLESTTLKEHLSTGRISGDTFYGVTKPSWDLLGKDKQEEFLRRVYQLGAERGFKKVHLINSAGKPVAYASELRFEVMVGL